MDTDYKLMKTVLSTIAQHGGFDDDDALLRRLTRDTGHGAIGSRFQDFLGGFNKTQQGSALPANTDMQGYTFFTRPNLNLSYDNIINQRQLAVLASKNPYSYNRAIRRMLWPDCRFERDGLGNSVADNKMFDHRHAFIPLLSNALTNMSGWPDMTLHAYSSSEGMAKEVWMMNDSIAEVNGRFSLDCTFENALGDPISLIIFSWLLYIGGVYLGTKLDPAGYSIVQNEIDYMTRIYRMSMDWTGKFVQKWAACGAAFPTGLSIGTAFNYSRDNPYNENNKSVQVTFECTVAEYNDPITLWEFNKLGAMHNEDMADDRREKQLIKIPAEDHLLFNYKGFPRVNIERDNELEWWLPKDIYSEMTKGSIQVAYGGGAEIPIMKDESEFAIKPSAGAEIPPKSV